ncbi:amidohydrolase family protein [Mycolicibacterium hodleri]|uniref:Amidohydrolase-related domain-containing protein n=1 Tax=Mycolicibacterium hodleri TaxID=49897 RepID=A0A502EFA7_9MYCO|nr:amidohydrolase family protein [Mycolicibacterium hodleri]TPG35031.1 hypothetical protein EAH80_09575 [Mycolicibacterium hodleri]
MNQGAVYLGRIYTPQAGGGWLELSRGALAVDRRGHIDDIGPAGELLSRCRGRTVVDFGEQLIVPGLVDCHQHLCHFDWYRLIADAMVWLKTIYELESRFNEPEYAWSTARRFFDALRRNGTTTVCVHGPYFAEALDIAFEEARSSGLRVIMGLNAGDRDLPAPLCRPAAESVADSVALHERWDGAEGGRLGYCFTVRPPYCSSPDLLAGMADAARLAGARVQSHLAEDYNGQRMILDLFPGSGSDSEVFDGHGVLGDRTIMAHAIYLQPGDLELLAARQISVAHCPRANLLAGGQQANVMALRSSGIKTGLGTDLGGGKGMSMFKLMEDALKVSPEFSVHDLMRMATLDGAVVLGLESDVGSLEIAKAADFIVTRPPLLEGSDEVDIDTLLANLIFCGGPEVVRHVVVNGVSVGEGAAREGVIGRPR